MGIRCWEIRSLVLVLLGALGHSHGRLVFNVETFGAQGDGLTDSTEVAPGALLIAWTVGCDQRQPVVLLVPNGTFLIKPMTFHGPCRANISLRSVRFEDCRHIKVTGVTIADSPHFHLQFHRCNHVIALSLQIMAPSTSPRTDGIHVQQTRNVHILNTTIGTGDDCVSVGHGSANVTISGLMCGPGHGISIGSLGKRDTRATVQNVLVDGATLTGTENGLRIKTWQGGHGWARNIAFRNIKMINVSNPIVIDQHYCDSPRPCANKTSAVKVSEVTFVGIQGTSRTDVAVRLACSKYVPCEHILLNDVSLRPFEEGGAVSSYCHNARGEANGEVKPPSCLS
ncbi:hypothetical protein H6P81_010142 [Aristolochia fimbriata]|uniref:Polygalacturonase n=1 Tax=Aristolochia fimbriata TaxID=158543 RepID=A0AAV7ERC1_ARIFI|nr:hypothetical protein H6P81_010142 [Aristolochia fimbriata]